MPIHDSGGSCSSSSDPFSRVRDQIQSQAICPVFRDQLSKIAVLFYNALRHGMDYADPGASYSEERYQQRVLANLQRRAKSLGYVLQQADTAPAAVGVS